MFDWTDERVAYTKKTFLEGGSCSQIAKVLGISRNAVIGKLARLGVGRGGGPSPPRRRAERAVAVKPPKATPSAPRRPDPAPPPIYAERRLEFEVFEHPFAEPAPAAHRPGGVNLLELGAGCKWPIGTVDGDMLFCGGPRTPGKPYCGAHASMASPSAKLSATDKAAAARKFHRSMVRLSARVA